MATAEEILTWAAGDGDIPTEAELHDWLSEVTAGDMNETVLSHIRFQYEGALHLWLPYRLGGRVSRVSDEDPRRNPPADDDWLPEEEGKPPVELYRCLKDGESELLGHGSTHERRFPIVVGIWIQTGSPDGRRILPVAPRGPIEEVHEYWLNWPEPRPEHPLIPLMKAWQGRPSEATPFLPAKRASIPRLQRISVDDPTLPGFPGPDAPTPSDQPALPGFEPTVTACPSWLLWLYDCAGGERMSQGRGAPWDMHFFVSSFLHLANRQRDGQWKTLRFPHLVRHEADWPMPDTPSIERWLFPEGWLKQNVARDWHKLPEALDHMKRELGYVPVANLDGMPGLGRIALVYPSVIPDSRDWRFVEFTIRVPTAAASGARVDWDLLRKYRLESAALYRAYLSACAVLDHAAHKGHGITAEIGAPVLRPDGKLKRRKGGAIMRSETEILPNRHAHFVKPLNDRDLTRLIGLNPDIRKHRYNARKALERLHDDGVIDLRKEGPAWRLFAPRKG